VPVLARKPGALRNGAPFKDWVLQAAMERIRFVEGLLRALRKSAVQRSIPQTAAEGDENAAQLPGAVGGSGMQGRSVHSPSPSSSPQC
jgi:hypothetical protein